MRISDWSSDVCSSDLALAAHCQAAQAGVQALQGAHKSIAGALAALAHNGTTARRHTDTISRGCLLAHRIAASRLGEHDHNPDSTRLALVETARSIRRAIELAATRPGSEDLRWLDAESPGP